MRRPLSLFQKYRSAMMSKKVLVVFGATGKQGGSVINSILEDPKSAAQFAIRAITRDPSKPNAQALSKKGVELFSVSSYHDYHMLTVLFLMFGLLSGQH
jgi:NmrA-like family